MTEENLRAHKLGWIGVGRMGFRLAAAPARRRVRPLDLQPHAHPKPSPSSTRGPGWWTRRPSWPNCDIVFSIVSGDDDFREITLGDRGVLAQEGAAPKILIDSTTISAGMSAEVRVAAGEKVRHQSSLAAPVSGNPQVVAAGKLTLVVSGPEDAFETARPYMDLLGAGSTYVGDADAARLAKICHNLMLGVVTQCMAEITVLAEKGGLERSAFLEFLNAASWVRLHPLQDARLREPRLSPDLHSCPASQGLRSRLEGRARARRADALGRPHPRARSEPHRTRPPR